MTKATDKINKWCYQCHFFDPIIFHSVGECTNWDSEHRSHVLTSMHAGCEQFKEKK